MLNSSQLAFEPALIDSIAALWEKRDTLSPNTPRAEAAPVDRVLNLLDAGQLRSAIRDEDGTWQPQVWVKQAILLSFRLQGNAEIAGGYDKVPLKWGHGRAFNFADASFRAVPGAIVRHSAYIAPGAVLMPSFVNVGARVGAGTMIDTWATVGSCAQIGDNCHISGGAGIGGVLEPLQAAPVIIEDNCFIGARSEVAEGVIIREGAVLSMGVYLGASTKIVDRETGAITRGEVPPYAVVVPGTLPSADGGPGLYCAVIVKRVDAVTRSKTSINALLRA